MAVLGVGGMVEARLGPGDRPLGNRQGYLRELVIWF